MIDIRSCNSSILIIQDVNMFNKIIVIIDKEIKGLQCTNKSS